MNCWLTQEGPTGMAHVVEAFTVDGKLRTGKRPVETAFVTD